MCAFSPRRQLVEWTPKAEDFLKGRGRQATRALRGARDRRGADQIGGAELREYARSPGKLTELAETDCMADGAVSCEPVSAPNSLLTGKLTGNFAESGRPPRFSHLISTQI
jgi:hypothetical protein